MRCGAKRRYGVTRQSATRQVVGFVFFCMRRCDGLGSRICLNVLRAGRCIIEFGHVNNTNEEVRISGTLM